MRCIVAAEPSTWAGTEINATALIDGLGSAGHRVDLWQFPRTGSEHYARHWSNRHGQMLEFAYSEGQREAWWQASLASNPPDLILLTKGYALTLLPGLDVAARRLGIPLVLLENEPALTPVELTRIGRFTYLREWKDAGYRALQRQQRLASLRISVSEITDRAMNGYLRWTKRRRKVVYPGIRFDQFWPDSSGRRRVRESLGIPQDAFVAGAIGRLHPKKRFDLALRLFESAGLPSAYFVLAGEGPERENLIRLAEQLNLTDRVRVVGWVDGPGRREFLSAIDCFLMLSTSEGLGMALVEAIACGSSVIATACGGPDEILRDPSLGRLVREGDWNQVVDALRNEAANPDDADGDQRKASRRERVQQHFDAGVQNACLTELLTTVAANGRR